MGVKAKRPCRSAVALFALCVLCSDWLGCLPFLRAASSASVCVALLYVCLPAATRRLPVACLAARWEIPMGAALAGASRGGEIQDKMPSRAERSSRGSPPRQGCVLAAAASAATAAVDRMLRHVRAIVSPQHNIAPPPPPRLPPNPCASTGGALPTSLNVCPPHAPTGLRGCWLRFPVPPSVSVHRGVDSSAFAGPRYTPQWTRATPWGISRRSWGRTTATVRAGCAGGRRDGAVVCP